MSLVRGDYMNKIYKNKSFIAIVIGIFLDQIIKIFVVKYQEIPVINGVLKFSYLKNSGMAFGLGDKKLLEVILSNIIVLGIVVRFMIMQKERIDKKTKVSLILIISGGISNLIDRIARGGVVDFAKFENINLPVFNLADVFVVFGFILFAYSLAIQTDQIIKWKGFSHNGRKNNSTK